jgi:LuxR family maltose regulon positive regulatory protein
MLNGLKSADFSHTQKNAWSRFIGGKMMTLLAWLKRLPEERIRSRPWLCVYHALILLLTGQLDAVELRLQDAEHDLQSLGWPESELQNLLGHIAAIRAYAASSRGEALRTIEYARQALKALPEDSLSIRSMVAFSMGAASYLNGDVVEAGKAFAEAGAIGRASGNIHLAVPAISAAAGVQVMQRRLRQAGETYQEILGLVLESSRTSPLAARVYSGLSKLRHEWNDLQTATYYAREAIRLGELWGSADVLAASHVALARPLQAQGDLNGAHDALQQAEQFARRHDLTPGVVEEMQAQRVRLRLAGGDLASATRWAEQSH